MKVLSKKGPHSLDQFIQVLHVNTVGTFNTIRLTSEAMLQNTPDIDGCRGMYIYSSYNALTMLRYWTIYTICMDLSTIRINDITIIWQVW